MEINDLSPFLFFSFICHCQHKLSNCPKKILPLCLFLSFSLFLFLLLKLYSNICLYHTAKTCSSICSDRIKQLIFSYFSETMANASKKSTAQLANAQLNKECRFCNKTYVLSSVVTHSFIQIAILVSDSSMKTNWRSIISIIIYKVQYLA